jgi:hypothetical protein
MTSRRRYRCRLCGAVLPAWIPVFEEPDVARLLHHLSYQHPDQVGASLARMRTEADIDAVTLEAYEAVEAFEVVEGEEDGI